MFTVTTKAVTAPDGVVDLVMWCETCGGTVPWQVSNYDDEMHKPGCRRRLFLDIWEEAKGISDLLLDSYKCRMFKNKDLSADGAFERNCPAANMLLRALPEQVRYLAPAAICGNADACYDTFFERYEEEVIELTEKFEKAGF